MKIGLFENRILVVAINVMFEVIRTDMKYFSGNVRIGRNLFYVIRTRATFSYNVLRFLSMNFSRLPVHG